MEMYVSLRARNAYVNMREGMSPTSGIVEQVDNGTLVQAEPMGEWAAVRTPSGETGFIRMEHLSPADPGGAERRADEIYDVPLTDEISLRLSRAAAEKLLEALKLME